jgi:hypothetical protein
LSWADISASNLPLSRTSISARRFAFCAIRSPSLRSSAPRWVAVISGQGPEVNAACAALMALSASCALPRAISAQGSPVKGS